MTADRETAERPETGPMQFGEDWPGVFLRGDCAVPMAMYLRMLLRGEAGAIERGVLEGFASTLESADVRNGHDPQRLPSLTAARTAAAPAWRREPPTVEEVRAAVSASRCEYPPWLFESEDTGTVCSVDLRVVEGVVYRWDPTALMWRPVEIHAGKWLPCAPTAAPSPGLVEAPPCQLARGRVVAVGEKRLTIEWTRLSGIRVGDEVTVNAALRAALGKDTP